MAIPGASLWFFSQWNSGFQDFLGYSLGGGVSWDVITLASGHSELWLISFRVTRVPGLRPHRVSRLLPSGREHLAPVFFDFVRLDLGA